MKEIIFRPELYEFDSCQAFAHDFSLGQGDLILTNRYIYEPYFASLQLPVSVIYQEQYGAGEPTDIMVDAILEDAAKSGCKRIIAIGGGTIIDIAKVLAVSDGEKVDDLYAKAADLQKKRRLVIVPTTCGTGSEVTDISILQLLEGLPFPVFATSSIDALVHAVESSLSPKATPYTKLFGYKAIEMIIKGYQKIAAEGKETRIPLLKDFLVASNFAGLAFGTAGCAAVHALSYPLGGTYHVPHGESNYAMFTGVLKNYMEIRSDGALAEMNAYLSGLLGCEEKEVYDQLEQLLDHILPKKALHEYGVTEQDLQDFTHAVMTTQGRLMGNNFVPLDEARVYKIYRELY